MEGFGCIRTEGENRPRRPGHIVLGCDLYNGTITGNKACNMNANSNNIVIEDGTAFNLMSMHGHDVHAVYFEVESIGHNIIDTQFSRGGCCDTLTASDYKAPIIVCYRISEYESEHE